MRFKAFSSLPELPPRREEMWGVQPLSEVRRRLMLRRGETRRIVVVANTQVEGFRPADYVRAGDFCIHLNHARHAKACMAVEGTRHAIIVRKDSEHEGAWFAPASFDGYERVIFFEQREQTERAAWFAEWRKRSAKSPTTGFLVANLCREKHPEVPLLLLGFDPLRNRGSYRWPGHDWEGEAAWYVEKGFSLLPPGALPVVHQIWLGAPMKEGMQAWVDGVREAACEAGWRHVLWDWSMLRQRFAADPITPWMERLMEVAPTPGTYGVVSDYYKHALMAAPYGAGTLYLDTDIFITGPWPAMPTDADVYVMTEQFRTGLRANGAFWLPPQRSEAPFTLTCSLMRQRLADFFSAPERLTADTVRRLYASTRVPYIIGPYFLRVHTYPAWDADGVRTSIFGKDLLSHLSWRHPASFTHVGTATWKQSASDNE